MIGVQYYSKANFYVNNYIYINLHFLRYTYSHLYFITEIIHVFLDLTKTKPCIYIGGF